MHILVPFEESNCSSFACDAYALLSFNKLLVCLKLVEIPTIHSYLLVLVYASRFNILRKTFYTEKSC